MKSPTLENNELKMLTKHDFAIAIESYVKNMDMKYIEAIIYFCDKNNIDIIDITKLCVGSLKEKLEVEARNNNILPKLSHTLLF
jgi:hypothetical protein